MVVWLSMSAEYTLCLCLIRRAGAIFTYSLQMSELAASPGIVIQPSVLCRCFSLVGMTALVHGFCGSDVLEETQVQG